MFENCSHENVINDACKRCGLYMGGNCVEIKQSFSQFRIQKSSFYNNFENDLKDIDIPNEVKKSVQQKVAMADKNITRLNCRKQMLFAYCYNSFLELNIDFKPEELAKKLGIKKNVREGLKLGAGISQKILPQSNDMAVLSQIVIITPITYISDMLDDLLLFDMKNDVIRFCEKILTEDENLYETKPNHMAAAMISYYCKQHDIYTPKISNSLKIKQSYINKCILKIEKNKKT